MSFLDHKTSVFSCRSSHLATGAAFIAVASFVGWLVEVQTKGMATMTLLHVLYFHAVYENKNVFHYIHIF